MPDTPNQLGATSVAPPGAESAPPADQQPATEAQPAQPAQPEKTFAGVFKTEDELYKGVREARNKLGIETAEDASIVGDDGLYPSVEHAERGYQELKGILDRGAHKPKAEPEKPTLDAPKPKPVDPANIQSVEDIVRVAGADPTELEDHWKQHGDLPEKLLKRLEKGDLTVPITAQMVREHVGVKYQLVQMRDQALQSALIAESGGDDEYSKIIKWGQESASPELKRLFKAALSDSENPVESARHVFRMLKQQYDASSPGEPSPQPNGVISGVGSATPSKVEGWGSHQEYLNAMAKSQAEHGSTNADPEFIARFNATPSHIITGVMQ